MLQLVSRFKRQAKPLTNRDTSQLNTSNNSHAKQRRLCNNNNNVSKWKIRQALANKSIVVLLLLLNVGLHASSDSPPLNTASDTTVTNSTNDAVNYANNDDGQYVKLVLINDEPMAAAESKNAPIEPAKMQQTTDKANEQAAGSSKDNLADYVATGTAAGLIFNDLMAQANMQSEEPVANLGPAHDAAETSASQSFPDGPPDGVQAASNGLGDGALLMNSGVESQVQPIDADHFRQQLAMFSNSQQQPNRQYQDDEQHQAEEQMPDNIESLMRSGGESVAATDQNEPDDDANGADESMASRESSADRHIATGSGPLMLGANLAELQQPVGLPAGAQNPNEASNDDDEDDDGDDDDGGGGGEADDRTAADGQRGQQLLMQQDFPNGQLAATPTALALGGDQSAAGLTMDGRSLAGAAPIRDSPIDLNTAAGHYYGKKKKKKKVKKLVIKKKKKKIVVKKKKKKKKKVKVIKKYKMKKKPKKMMHHDHGKYYMYAKVPKKKSWEFGFKKGNKKHWIERHEKGHKNKFKTKVKWYDKKSKGKGFHIWDYNHHDKKKKKHHYG